VISVLGGAGDLAEGGGSARAAQFDDTTSRSAPPDGLKYPGRQGRRASPTLVTTQSGEQWMAA